MIALTLRNHICTEINSVEDQNWDSDSPSDESSPTTCDTATQAPAKRGRKVRPAVPLRKVDHMPSWRVLLHNDDMNEMNFVVDSILRLTPLSFNTAYRCMLEAHEHGLSILLVTHQERAELYRDQFRSKRLVVSIEPVG